jgi:hypothetical protein
MINDPNATKRQTEVDWSDWNGSSVAPEDELSQPVERDCHKGGEHITKEDLRKDGEKIIAGARMGDGRQPTNEELFGHLVRPKEDLEKMEDDWNNFFNNSLEGARKPVDDVVKAQLPPQLQEEAWPSGTSFNDMLDEEEVKNRGKFVGR